MYMHEHGARQIMPRVFAEADNDENAMKLFMVLRAIGGTFDQIRAVHAGGVSAVLVLCKADPIIVLASRAATLANQGTYNSFLDKVLPHNIHDIITGKLLLNLQQNGRHMVRRRWHQRQT